MPTLDRSGLMDVREAMDHLRAIHRQLRRALPVLVVDAVRLGQWGDGLLTDDVIPAVADSTSRAEDAWHLLRRLRDPGDTSLVTIDDEDEGGA